MKKWSMMLCAMILLSVSGFAQSNGVKAADPEAAANVNRLPACPTLDGVDDGVAAALAKYCAAVLAAHAASVDRAVTEAAAAVERELRPKLAAAEAAHRACTLEGAILGAGLSLGAVLLGHGVTLP